MRFARAAVILVAVLAIGIVVWAVVSGGGDDNKTAKPELQQATAAQLSTLAAQQGHDVYWVGPKPGVRYEWTRTADKRLYVRYLQGNTPVGSRQRAFLTVATYALKDAVDGLKAQAAKHPNSQSQAARGGGFAYYDPGTSATSAYYAASGSDYEVEVFDPKPGRAFMLVAQGKVVPIP